MKWEVFEKCGVSGYLAEDSAVFEIGCAEGTLLASFRERGFAVSGVEPLERYGAFARDHFGLDITIGFFDERFRPKRAPDLIVIDNVLEHLPDPAAALAAARRLIAEDGCLLILVPNVETPAVGNAHVAHYTLWSRHSLETALAAAGFEVISISPGRPLRRPHEWIAFARASTAAAQAPAPNAKPSLEDVQTSWNREIRLFAWKERVRKALGPAAPHVSSLLQRLRPAPEIYSRVEDARRDVSRPNESPIDRKWRTRNMTTNQQQEALDYFRTHARDWRSKADGVADKVNVIEQRNGYVLQVAEERSTLRTFLDVGCGTGELTCRMAQRGVDSTGVDYAREMIELSSRKAHDEKVTGAKFVCASIFDFDMPAGSYDLISANGFIEYVSQDQMRAFFDRVAHALAPGGSFVVGSRNRLFNLVSMNAYTAKEARGGDTALLLEEAVKWTQAGNLVDFTDAEVAALERTDISHASTGIDVSTRFQYTPFQLISMLRQRGLRPAEVYPVHIHAAPPAFKEINKEVHVSIANLLQTHARHNTRLLANASTFMLHVTKAA